MNFVLKKLHQKFTKKFFNNIRISAVSNLNTVWQFQYLKFNRKSVVVPRTTFDLLYLNKNFHKENYFTLGPYLRPHFKSR